MNELATDETRTSDLRWSVSGDLVSLVPENSVPRSKYLTALAKRYICSSEVQTVRCLDIGDSASQKAPLTILIVVRKRDNS